MARKGEMAADEIAKQAKRLQVAHGQQQKLDEQAVCQYTQDHIQEVYDPQQNKQGDFKVRPVGSGMVGTMVDRDVNVLRPRPFARVIARGGQTAEKHASDVLEPWLNTAIWIGQGDFDVWNTSLLDVRLVGGTMQKVLPAPQFLGDFELQELVEEWNRLVDSGGDTEDVKERIRIYQRDNFPIRWLYVDITSTYVKRDSRGVSEVYEITTISPDHDLWAVLPEELKDTKSQEIIDWANHTHVATVLPEGGGVMGFGKRPSEFLKSPWEHGMGTYPYVLIQGDPMRRNNRGHVRRGAHYHAREMVQAVDESLTDYRTVMRKEVESPPLIKMNPKLRARLGLDDKEIKIDPNQPVIIYGDETGEEEVGRYPTAVVNPQMAEFIQFLAGYADRSGAWRPPVVGAGPSGQSAVHLDTARQAAVGQLQVVHDNLEAGFGRVGELFFRARLSLGRDFPDIPDIAVVRVADKNHGSKEINVTDADVKNYEPMVRGKIRMALPVNRGAAVTNARLLTDPQHPLMSDNTAREAELDFENPQEEGDKIHEQNMLNDIIQVVRTKIQQRALLAGEQLTPEDLQALAAGMASMPEVAQAVLVGQFGENPPRALIEQLGRSQANAAQAGRGQRMSQLQGVQGG